MAEAGYPDGDGFPTVTYRYFSNTLEEALAQALQAMWKETLNVNVELEAQDFPVFLAGLKPDVPVGEMPEMWRLGWGADYPDENNFVYEVFHCTDSTNYPRGDLHGKPTNWPNKPPSRPIRPNAKKSMARSSR